MVFDFSGLTHISSDGLKVILGAVRRLRAEPANHGLPVVFVNGYAPGIDALRGGIAAAVPLRSAAPANCAARSTSALSVATRIRTRPS